MSLAGKLLTAPPNIKGNFWSKTVIFVTEDHDRGSVGFVLNKPTKMSIKEFSAQHGVDSDVPGVLHVGGPVNVNALTVLHSSEWTCNNTMKVTDDFSISSSGDLLLKFALGDQPTGECSQDCVRGHLVNWNLKSKACRLTITILVG